MTGFWIFLSVLLICDTYLFSRGFNSFFHSWKTEEEKRIREGLIRKLTEDNTSMEEHF